MKTKEFISRLRSIRGSVQRDKEILNVVRMAVRARVEDRAQYLSEAMPETFGSIVKVGMTPAQALLIIYSVASDNLMNFIAPNSRQKLILGGNPCRVQIYPEQLPPKRHTEWVEVSTQRRSTLSSTIRLLTNC
jgi:hypothetical protein